MFSWNNNIFSISKTNNFLFDTSLIFSLIYVIFFFWFITIIICYFINNVNKIYYLKILSLLFTFLILILLVFFFFSVVLRYNDITFLIIEIFWLHFFNISYIIYIDFFSFFFLFLTAFIIPFCILSIWNYLNINFFFFFFILWSLEFLLFGVFSISDLIIFYMYFESILIPMYLLLGIWGTRYRKIHAANLLFLYTFIGSIFFLLSAIYLLNIFNTTSWNFLLLLTSYLSENIQYFLWFGFFLSFAVKVPMFPFHIWLPEAHVEAPTVGSIILAAILLKLGTYGMLRYLIFFFFQANIFFQPFIFTLAILGVIYSSLVTLRQIDIKKIIAYSSVTHMNLALLGLFSFNLISCSGSYLMMISHGLISSALFFSIGIIYERFHSKIIKYYGGLVFYMPLFSIFFLFFSFANFSFPLTFGFVSELLIFLGLFSVSPFICILCGFSVIFGAIYSIWLYNRIFYGQESLKLSSYLDISRLEFILLLLLLLFVCFFGIFPHFFLEFLEFSFIFYLL